MTEPIERLNSNDVLFGRGMGPSMYIGTQKFREMCEPKKQAYRASQKHTEKNNIAQEIVADIRAKGGRFLKQDEDINPVDDIVEEGVWYEVHDEGEILDKTKQTLRQKYPTKRGRSTESTSTSTGIYDMDPILSTEMGMNRVGPAFSAMSLLPSVSAPVSSSVSTAVDPRLLLFQAAAMNTYAQSLLIQQQQILLTSTLNSGVPLAESSLSVVDESHGSVENPRPPARTESTSTEVKLAVQRNDEEEVSEDVEEFLLSVLQLSGLPRFTDHAAEQANMTDEERASALSDMFGKYSDVNHHENKKIRRGLDAESISFLVKYMRNEIERIPENTKQALLEAQEKCEHDEFSDERLECFLRSERMDAELAAKRFVTYWERRRDLFGPEKFVQCMTLSEALSDNCVALKIGWLQLLPNVDASGRQLLVLEPARHTKNGYTSDSLLRAAWYVIEVASRTNTDVEKGFVLLVWDKNSTVWEYDHWLYKHFNEDMKMCWPCKLVCIHNCCSPKFIVRVVAPILSAFQSKQGRAATIWHDAPDEEIISVLAEYGITGDMLPMEFGGSIELNPSEWIAKRSAIEMKEL